MGQGLRVLTTGTLAHRCPISLLSGLAPIEQAHQGNLILFQGFKFSLSLTLGSPNLEVLSSQWV